jgi:hypothetical protein
MGFPTISREDAAVAALKLIFAAAKPAELDRALRDFLRSEFDDLRCDIVAERVERHYASDSDG